MEKVIIYGLYNPLTLECFYVGKTKQSLKNRLYQHVKERQTNTNKDLIITDILSENKTPVIKELLIVNDGFIESENRNLWELMERYVIDYFRYILNEPLVNIAEGGEDCYKIGRKTPIKQFDLKGNFVKEYDMIVTAAREIIKNDLDFKRLSTVQHLIRNCVYNKSKSAYGFQWCLVGNEEQIKTEVKRVETYKHSPEVEQRLKLKQLIKEQERTLKEQERIEYNNRPEVIEERKLKELQSRRKYKTTDKGKEAKERYKQTESYKESKKNQYERYKQTESYKEYLKNKKERYHLKKKLQQIHN